MSTTATDRIRTLVQEEVDDLIAIRRDLHAHPELGYEEHRTSQLVKRQLTDSGVEFVGGLAGGTGVVAHISGSSGQCVGLRADMDALPIREETGLPYASTNEGVMHACGHDGHTTILIGAARVLERISKEDGLPHPVTFCFQPAEEGLSGGKKMVEDGCLDGSRFSPPVARMFGLHGWPTLELGKLGTRVGPFLAAADKFEITVRGRGSHAAFPHWGRDPIVCASALVTALQTIASRNVDPLESVVLSVTTFHAGTAFNVIPESVTLQGTVRTLSDEVQELTRERMEAIISHTAQGFGCEAALQYEYGYPVTRNDADAVAFFEDTVKTQLGSHCFERMAQPVMGAEDFAYYCREVPSCFFALGLRPPGQDDMPILHHPKFDFNDDAIALGVETFCRLALRG